MRDINEEAPNFVDKKDCRFSVLHKTLDSVFRELRTANVGTTIRNAEPLYCFHFDFQYVTLVRYIYIYIYIYIIYM